MHPSTRLIIDYMTAGRVPIPLRWARCESGRCERRALARVRLVYWNARGRCFSQSRFNLCAAHLTLWGERYAGHIVDATRWPQQGALRAAR
jgi:hypothetical protein